MSNKILLLGGIALALILLVGGALWTRNAPGKLDGFAQCIADSGTKFYGAFWCPHCQNQKKMFGNSAEYLPYIECSAQDTKHQLQVCTDAGVTGYPTWEFPNGERMSGEVPLETLAEKTNCELP